MQTANVLETPEYLTPPECKSESVRTISREKLAWLAGIIDGEGHMSVNYNNVRHSLRLQIGNTCPYMIRDISEMYITLKAKFFYQLVRSKTGRYFLRIETSGTKSVCRVLYAIRKFLVTKQKQANAMLEFRDWRKTISHNLSSRDRERVIAKYIILKERLSKLNNGHFNLQRLPRRASVALDLSRQADFEVMV